MINNLDVNILMGKILVDIKTVYSGPEIYELIFTLNTGKQYKMYHDFDCCEDVYLEDICGDLDDILNSPILLAEEVIHVDEDPPNLRDTKILEERSSIDSFTWTFYKFSTINGSVTLRWYGLSNGYYSERVDFVEI